MGMKNKSEPIQINILKKWTDLPKDLVIVSGMFVY